MKKNKIISREAAIKRGLKRFFTGVPCKHGHISERYVMAGSERHYPCVECYVFRNQRQRPTRQRYARTPLGREAERRRSQSVLGQERRRRMRSYPKAIAKYYRAKERRWKRKENDAYIRRARGERVDVQRNR